MPSLNLTKPRQAVLNAVMTARNHPTATDVMDALNKQGYRFAYATIYNSLRYLSDHRLIQELQFGDGIAHYDGRLEPHVHVICQRCGTIAEAAASVPPEWLENVENETGFTVHEIKLHFKGLCKECHSASEQH